jgi:unsaturated rhamnogalacturonyl hydrolase
MNTVVKISGMAMVLFFSACVSVQAAKTDPEAEKQAAQTLATMLKVADWQLVNPSKHHPLDWTHGALYPGYMALDGIQANSKYRDAVKKVGEENGWKNWTRTYHADDYAVAQVYAELYQLARDPVMLKPTIEQFDLMLANPATCEVGEIVHGKRGSKDAGKIKMRWWWCDALFMAPAAWTKIYDLTDDPKYLDFMLKEWKATSEFLYDKEEHLFFRDKKYFPENMKEKNGKKVFWGRGNGWVLGGLVRVLQVLPDNHPDRPFFVNQFQEI